MKKLFTLFTTVLVSIFCTAVNLNHSPRLVINTDTEDAVSIYYTDVEDGVLSVIWQGDSAKSQIYDLYLATLDTNAYSYQGFAELAAYSKAFAISGYDGYFSCSTDLILQYGDNYSTIGDYGATADVVAAWEAAWLVSANDDNTLKSGVYVLFIEGDDLSWNTTEAEDYVIFEVEGQSEGFHNIVNRDSSLKIIKKGQLMIVTEIGCFDSFGRKIK